MVTLVAWQLIGAPIDFSIVRVVTVLVIACPHALGLAVPLVVAISTTMGASGGLLVRDRRGLEEARNLDVVVFDKTGTRAWRADPLDQLFFSGVPGVRRPGSRLRPSPV